MYNKTLSHIISFFFFIGIFFSVLGHSSAASGDKLNLKNETGSSLENQKYEEPPRLNEEKNESTDTNENKSPEKKAEEEKIKQNIDISIVELWVIPKARKFVKELSIAISEKYPNVQWRLAAYKEIQLTCRKIKINRIKVLPISNNRKDILSEYLDTVIDLLAEKIEELE